MPLSYEQIIAAFELKNQLDPETGRRYTNAKIAKMLSVSPNELTRLNLSERGVLEKSEMLKVAAAFMEQVDPETGRLYTQAQVAKMLHVSPSQLTEGGIGGRKTSGEVDERLKIARALEGTLDPETGDIYGRRGLAKSAGLSEPTLRRRGIGDRSNDPRIDVAHALLMLQRGASLLPYGQGGADSYRGGIEIPANVGSARESSSQGTRRGGRW